jgi:signal transduction histidine kinase
MAVETQITKPLRRTLNRRKELEQNLEHITEEMYKRNKELADTNRTLSLLRTIDSLVLDADNSLRQISAEITKSITDITDYPFVAIFGHTDHSPSQLEVLGYSAKKEAITVGHRFVLPEDLILHTNHTWFKDAAKTKILQIDSSVAEKASKMFKLEVEEVNKLMTMLPVSSLYLLKLRARGGLVGVVVVGFTHTVHSHDVDGPFIDRLGEAIGVALDNKILFEENKRVAAQLRRSNAKLKALDAAKDEFISMASHQLRTPLTAIKGYLSMILEGDVGAVKPKQRAMMQQSFDGAQRMVYLISDLLNVSRMQTGKFVIDNQPSNLAEVIVGEIAQLKEQADAKEIKITYQKPQDFPSLNLDETKIRQVIMNFLDNALYYTPNGGKVDVKLVESPESISFTVVDNGVGVPKSVQHNMFTKFYRADNARKMRPDGTGLGLFMAKKVVVAQGGAIIFNSVEGKGSTFGFSFPRAAMEIKPGQTPPNSAGSDTEEQASVPITNPL